MEPVDPLVVEMLETWPTIPAFVRSAGLDVLASNRLAREVSASFAVGVNLARFAFLSPSTRDTRPGTRDIPSEVVTVLRQAVACSTQPESLATLIGELSSISDEFSKAWAEEVAFVDFNEPIMVDHPRVGQLSLTYHQLLLPGTTQTLVVGHAERGSESEKKLSALAAMAARSE